MDRPPPVTSYVDYPPEVDYSNVIRKEIEAEVAELIQRVEGYVLGGYWYPIDPIVAEYIELGYVVNMHRGRDLYSEGDLIHGLPVRIDRELTRSISVCANGIQFEWDEIAYRLVEGEGGERDEEDEEQSNYDEQDIRETITW